MSNAVDLYFEGIKIVEETGKRISRRSVAMAVGRDPSAIKSNRPEMDPVIEAIDEAERKRKKKELPINKEKRIKEDYRNQVKELENQLKAAYAREVMMIKRIDVLEKENKNHEKSKLNKYGVNNIQLE